MTLKDFSIQKASYNKTKKLDINNHHSPIQKEKKQIPRLKAGVF